ncbi:hypothetical protein NDU88_000825 [Pleurodeles waltl]|uniref:Uncharacterized protein n=1 Tax=Pleurodeles waltl TaxID=8319 RepID=A0AAV7LFU8_PLEWA|nr:hypothetical protein NDU88_000825 [Pleurodeles waltl]
MLRSQMSLYASPGWQRQSTVPVSQAETEPVALGLDLTLQVVGLHGTPGAARAEDQGSGRHWHGQEQGSV